MPSFFLCVEIKLVSDIRVINVPSGMIHVFTVSHSFCQTAVKLVRVQH